MEKKSTHSLLRPHDLEPLKIRQLPPPRALLPALRPRALVPLLVHLRGLPLLPYRARPRLVGDVR